MAGLAWHSATARHRQALSQLVITDPPKHAYEPHRGRHHPRPWELEVQSHLRGLKVPVAPGEAMLLGFDDDGIAAATHFGFDDTQTQFIIWAVGCAHRCRRRGHGREALERALQALRRTKQHYGLDCGVFTYVDPRNEASRPMVQQAGFEFLAMYDGYEGWVCDI